MRVWTLDHPCGMIVVTYQPSKRWKLPKRDDWVGDHVINAGRVSIGFWWHWPPRVPV